MRTPHKAPGLGFTLIEMMAAVLLIGILSAIAIPQYFKVVEKSRAKEATDYLVSLRAAQERYFAKYGNFCTTNLPCPGMDFAPPALNYFNVGAISAGSTGNSSWKLSLTRSDSSALYGAYVISEDIEPNSPPSLGCCTTNGQDCSTDLLNLTTTSICQPPAPIPAPHGRGPGSGNAAYG